MKRFRCHPRTKKAGSILALIVCLSLLPVLETAWAATGADILEVDIAARASALGAGAADANGVGALAFNPAGLLGSSDLAFSLTHVASFGDFSYEQIEVLIPGGLGGNWAARLLYAGNVGIPEFDVQGDEIGGVAYSDVLAQAAYAISLMGGLEAGLAAGFLHSRLAEFASQGFTLDAGMRYAPPGWPVAMGVAVQNFGKREAFVAEADELPLHARAGVSAVWEANPDHRFRLLADYIHPLVEPANGYPVVGLEYQAFHILSLRAGYRWLVDTAGPLSAGVGIQWGGASLDYAFQPMSDLGPNHRLTFTYAFVASTETVTETPRSQAAPTPAPTTEPVRPGVRQLREEVRMLDAQMRFVPPQLDAAPREWELEIRSEEGVVVKSFKGKGAPPKELVWEARGQEGRMLPRDEKYQFIFKADQQERARQILPTLRPPTKLQFSRNIAIEMAVHFRFAERPEIRRWSLEIKDDDTGKIVKTLKNLGGLPNEIVWDGRNERQRPADTRHDYSYTLTVTYPDQSVARVREKITPVKAKRIQHAKKKSDSTTLVITGINFDFDSADLKPDTMDKIQAAAEILRKYGTRAKIVCEGHTDEVGSDRYNLELSKERADMVARFLKALDGVPARSVTIKGYGKNKPVVKLGDQAERNRRVELRLVFPVKR